MTTQIWLHRTGGPEVLRVRTADRHTPAPGQAWLEQDAIGVNYLDVTQRKGACRSRCRAASVWRVRATSPRSAQVSPTSV